MSMLACQYNQPKRPGDLDLLTLKVVSESRVTWAISVPILGFLGIFALDLGPMYVTDRRQTASSLNAPMGGGIIMSIVIISSSSSSDRQQMDRLSHRQTDRQAE